MSLEDSVIQMNNYHMGNGTKSWLCHFFNIPEDVVALIRAYTTPPPVFYFEPDDVVLVYCKAETNDCYCEKYFVLRKADPNSKQVTSNPESIALMNSEITETPGDLVELLWDDCSQLFGALE